MARDFSRQGNRLLQGFTVTDDVVRCAQRGDLGAESRHLLLESFPLDSFSNDEQHLVRPKGLRDEVVRTAFDGIERGVVVAVGAHHDDECLAGLHPVPLEKWKYTAGSGLRVSWNQATVLIMDIGFSTEDWGFYLNFGHIF